MTAEERGLKEGYRSGLEEKIAAQLNAAGVSFEFEKVKVPYVTPPTPHKYCPDFILKNGIVVESKGRFMPDDRQKQLLVKKQHPDIDIRFVFSNPNQRITKTSTTTYAMWCEKNGYLYAKGLIPPAWLKESPNKPSIAAIAALHGTPK